MSHLRTRVALGVLLSFIMASGQGVTAFGSTHVRYDRTYNGLRVVGGDLVSHRVRSGTIKSVSWNGSRQVSVASTTPKVSLVSARAAGVKKASFAQKTTSASKVELVVYSAGASTKAPPKLA